MSKDVGAFAFQRARSRTAARAGDAVRSVRPYPVVGSSRILRFSLAEPGGASDPRAIRAVERCRAIRSVVFIDGQGVPAALEWDGLDADAEHFLVWRDGDPRELDRAVGTARLREVDGAAKAERVAVLAFARGHGLGRTLMAAIDARARERGLAEIRLNAQLPVIPFYEELDYRAEGDVFLSAGIEHRAMRKPTG